MANILIVEANCSIRELMVESLEELGHNVKDSAYGAEAIDICYLFSPDVIICELDLDCDYDGFEIAAACYHADSHAKTIVISSNADRLSQSKGHEHVFSTLMKPFSFEQFAQTVDTALHEKAGSVLTST